MRRLEDHLEKLRPFSVIAENGSLHRAAAKLHTSQPALSQMLRTLEDDLGVKLFVRSPRGMVMTEAGEKLHAFANQILKQTSEFQIANSSDTAYRVHIAAYESLIDLLAKHLRTLPGAGNYYVICHESGLQMIDRVVGGDVDYVVLAEPPKLRGMVFETLISARYGLYATPEFLKANPKLDFETLQSAPLIFVPGSVSSTTGIIDRFISSSGLGQGVRLTTNSYIAARSFTLNGHGFGFLVSTLVAQDVRKKTLVEIDLPKTLTRPVTSICLGYRQGQQIRSHHEHVRKALFTAFEELH